MKTIGSRAQVWHGTAKKTQGGLTKKDLFKRKGRIKSKRASKKAKRNNNLKKAGWTFKKGQFGAVKIGEKSEKKSKKKSSKKKSKKQKGGDLAEIKRRAASLMPSGKKQQKREAFLKTDKGTTVYAQDYNPSHE